MKRLLIVPDDTFRTLNKGDVFEDVKLKYIRNDAFIGYSQNRVYMVRPESAPIMETPTESEYKVGEKVRLKVWDSEQAKDEEPSSDVVEITGFTHTHIIGTNVFGEMVIFSPREVSHKITKTQDVGEVKMAKLPYHVEGKEALKEFRNILDKAEPLFEKREIENQYKVGDELEVEGKIVKITEVNNNEVVAEDNNTRYFFALNNIGLGITNPNAKLDVQGISEESVDLSKAKVGDELELDDGTVLTIIEIMDDMVIAEDEDGEEYEIEKEQK